MFGDCSDLVYKPVVLVTMVNATPLMGNISGLVPVDSTSYVYHNILLPEIIILWDVTCTIVITETVL